MLNFRRFTCRLALASGIWLAQGPLLTANEPDDPATAGAGPTAADLEFFEKQVRPLLANHCHKCHGPDEQKGGLRLDSRLSLLAGGDTGPAVVPGKPDESLLVDAVGWRRHSRRGCDQHGQRKRSPSLSIIMSVDNRKKTHIGVGPSEGGAYAQATVS